MEDLNNFIEKKLTEIAIKECKKDDPDLGKLIGILVYLDYRKKISKKT